MRTQTLLTQPLLARANAEDPRPPEVTVGVPDWAGGFVEMLSWVSWFALGICVLGVIISGGAMALASRRGDGGEHATRLGWVLMGCILIGSASGIVTAILAA